MISPVFKLWTILDWHSIPNITLKKSLAAFKGALILIYNSDSVGEWDIPEEGSDVESVCLYQRH